MSSVVLPFLVMLCIVALTVIGGVLLFRRNFVHVDPDEFVVHYRNGKIANVGRGRSFFCLPFDTYLKVPGTLRDVNFCADQITVEKQGVRVQGFLAYKIVDFQRAYEALDFKSHHVKVLPACEENAKNTGYADKSSLKVIALDPGDPLAKTDVILRQLAESVVRHEVSNKTLQQMVMEREKVRESMRQQLMETVDDWGISIDTIEFTEVWIRSKEVFENLQADYRNQLKLQSEISTHETNKAIAEKRLESERTVAQLEAEAERVRRVAQSMERLQASKVEIDNQRQAKEKVLEAESAVKDQERESVHRATLRDAELVRDRELIQRQHRLAVLEREHQVAMEERAKLEAIKVREQETAKKLAEMEARRLIEQAELERQRSEVTLRAKLEEEEASSRVRIEGEKGTAEMKKISSVAEADRLIQLAEAERKAAFERAEAIRAAGEAEAEVIAKRIAAENQINLRQIQKLLVGELSKMAAQMKVNDVNWVNISGSADDSPLGIVPRNIVQLLSVFKGMGLSLDQMLHGTSCEGHEGGKASEESASKAAEPENTQA